MRTEASVMKKTPSVSIFLEVTGVIVKMGGLGHIAMMVRREQFIWMIFASVDLTKS